jgi:hypothetical protein
MIYDVSESRFYEVKDIKEIKKHSYSLLKINTEDNILYFNLKVMVDYLDINNEEKNKELIMPIELNTRPLEELEVNVDKIILEIVEEKGIELEFFLNVKITESMHEIIKEEYQEELVESLSRDEIIEEIIVDREEVLEEKDDGINVIEAIEEAGFDLCKLLKTTYQKYKMLVLSDESSFDKISLKYNIPIDNLYKMKKDGLKVLVYVKE